MPGITRNDGDVNDMGTTRGDDGLPAATSAFLLAQAAALEPLEFLLVGAPGRPDGIVEVSRLVDGAWVTRVPGRPPTDPLPVAERTKLVEAGFRSTEAADPSRPWDHPAEDAEAAVGCAVAVLRDVFAVDVGGAIDIGHGSHRQRHEAEQQLAAVRSLLEPVLVEALGHPPEHDADGDWFYPYGSAQVVVAPRALPGAPAVVRVFAVTNIGVNVSPELAMFLANLNVQLLFGRWGLDAMHRAVWVDETLLAQDLTPAAFRFALDTVAKLADQFDSQIGQMFGGATFVEARQRQSGEEMKAMKPGAGGYL